MSNICISCVIPTYNGLQRLKQTIASVLNQTRPADEIIVVDDGSTDDTRQIVKIFQDKIKYIHVENGGQQRARNIGVQAATGDWIALLDHDDLWEPGYLQEVEALISQGTVDMTMCNSRTRQESETGAFWKDEYRFTSFAPPNYWERVGASPGERWTVLERYDYASYLDFHPSQTSMVAVRRSLFLELGGFDTRMRGSGAENFEFEIRALRVARVGLIWQPLVTMIRHDSNASLDNSRMAMDVADCLDFALSHHGLNDEEKSIVRWQLQKRLPIAMEGAYTLKDFRALAGYSKAYGGRSAPKLKVKQLIASASLLFAELFAAKKAR